MAALGAARAQGPRTADHARLGVFIGKWNVAGERAQPGRPLRWHPQWCLGPRRLLPRYALQRHRQWATGEPDRSVRLGCRQQALHLRHVQQPRAARQLHRLRRRRHVDLVGGTNGKRHAAAPAHGAALQCRPNYDVEDRDVDGRHALGDGGDGPGEALLIGRRPSPWQGANHSQARAKSCTRRSASSAAELEQEVAVAHEPLLEASDKGRRQAGRPILRRPIQHDRAAADQRGERRALIRVRQLLEITDLTVVSVAATPVGFPNNQPEPATAIHARSGYRLSAPAWTLPGWHDS